MPTAAALVARLVTVLAVVAAVLCCLHPSAGTLASAAPVVTLQRVPAPALPVVEHCWQEPSSEVLSGDPALAVAGSSAVACP